ncbi:magnesium transporter NIPA [Toxoplasma gondii GAB2-2007-GAL-DOM2]|uniref:Magnesium transporter NIPA n=1 Tax=Toxoplasma gondii GAB2-2007-GAL-DOM2 TaxID=1130820 RepID=A0A086KNB6_TOXGO|nr:magnesium transporter NIPA [Toxoplasma gondii GAB2-2007-GAL-DOM2]
MADLSMFSSSPPVSLEELMESCHSLQSTWCIGVVLCLLSSFAGALGDNIVRLSFLKERGRSVYCSTRSLHQRPLWLIGTLLTVIVNPVLTLLALKLAAASIVLPFAGMHIFWNVILVGYLLREELLGVDIIGSLCIIFGIVVVIAYGAHQLPSYTLASLTGMASHSAFTVYLLVSSLVVICFMFAIATPVHRGLAWLFMASRVQDCVTGGLLSGSSFVSAQRGTDSARLSPGLSAQGLTRPPLWLQRLSVSALSGIFGGLGNLSAKAAIEVVSSEGFAMCIRTWGFYVCCTSTLVLCGLQLVYLNLALSRYEAKYVVPMVNATLIASGSVGGILLFQEYAHMSLSSIAAFSCGACLVVLGIIILAMSSSKAASKASPPEFMAQRMLDLDATDDERRGLNCEPSFPKSRMCVRL